MKIKESKKMSDKAWEDIPCGGVVTLQGLHGVWMKIGSETAVDLTDGETDSAAHVCGVEFYYPNATVELGNAE